MSLFHLNLFLKISALLFLLKQKIVKEDKWYKLMPYVISIIILELLLSIIALPLYLFASPEAVINNVGGFKKSKKRDEANYSYLVRRKVSITTFSSLAVAFFVKFLLIGVISFYLLGGHALLAATESWTFTTPANYTYDSAKIEVTGDTARLKNLGGTVSGNTTNPSFDSDITGWTYADWDQGGGEVNIAGSRIASGGNPNGYIQISAPSGKDDELGGYYYQAFTTTVANPTVTLNFDRIVSAYASSPITFKFYVFVDTVSTAPTIGTEAYVSSEITSTSAWASTTNLDVSSKVTTAGTYYLKVAFWLETGGTNVGPFTAGYDNVLLNWTKTTTSYATDSPTITPTTSLNPANVSSWDSFTETANLNGGSINYQLSDDDGATWKYWTGSAWAAAGASNYNSASVVHTNIVSFPTTNNKIMWKAFLMSNGTQQVILDNIDIGYTVNDLPDVLSLTGAQRPSATGIVDINYNLSDDNSDPSSLSTYEYSLTGAFAGEQATMTALTSDPAHSGISSLTTSPSGIAHTFVWNVAADLGTIYDSTVYVRLRGNDGAGDGAYTISSAFAVDLTLPVISSVTASQTAGSTNVSIGYTISDDTLTDAVVELDISEDSGATWTVVDTSVTGDVGAGVSIGSGKTITWAAGVDFDEQLQTDIRVRVRAKDKFYNQGLNVESTDFSLDTLNPATNVASDLQAQPNAGDTTVLIGGSFVETNPDTNNFYVAINGGVYGPSTAGTSNTNSPANQASAVGSTLDGNDYISKVKITHTDDFDQAYDNENTSPAVAYKYVKPYTPATPTVDNPVTNRVDVTINPNASETSGLEYAIYETSQGKYVQSDGTLGASPVWQVLGTSAGQWGDSTAVSGKVRVTGLTSPVANYIFQTKSRNTSDGAHASSSESAYSSTAKITNTAPSILLGSIGQTTDGTQYTTINYTGTDAQGDINTLATYEYSLNNSTWATMTEKSGVGSEGVTNLTFLSTGSAHNFKWDSGTDASGVEDSTVYIRLKSNDGLTDSTLQTSTAFAIDNVLPVISGVSAVQNAGAKTVAITYTLTDGNNSTVEIDISEDGGSTWTVTDTSVSGDIGAGVTSGSKSITWNAGADFNNQYQTDIQVRLRALDTFGNQGSNTASVNFTVDTKSPVVTNVTAVQDSETDTFTFNYDVSEDSGNVTIALAISSNSGSTWVVPTTSATGAVGSGITPGTGKTITWDGATDYNNAEEQDMQIRITATDSFTNSQNLASTNFSLDTYAPRVTSVSASQTTGSTNVAITYNLADQNNSLVEIGISQDSGATWTVTDTSVTGDIGSGISAGTGKSVTWAAGTDFDEQSQSDLRVRVRAKDTYNHQGSNVSSTDFALDTLNPATNVTANLQAQPNAGDTNALIGGSFTEANPNTNDFYLAINGGDYGSASAGDTNTASPANKATAVGATLDGNDYISKVKIIHTDDFGQTVDNENTSPNIAYKYVKPYTPLAPTVNNPTVGTVDVLINPNASETSGLEYAIYETSQAKYVQADGSLGVSEVWQTTTAWGTVTVNGLVNDSYTYTFQVKSRNTSDTGNATSSESALSAGASSTNQSPTINIDTVAQTTDGSQYVTINYTGTDLESESANIITVQYSTNNSTWFTMTEKSGVGSDGTTAISFTSGGSTHDFMWDVATDLANTEDSTVYVRLQANDGTSSGSIDTSSAFTVDTKNPVISSVTASQTLGTNNVSFGYTLTDLSNSTVEVDISEDGGSNWTVTDTSVTGDIGSGVVSGAGKSVTWDAGTDFNNQDQTDMRTRFRALDAYGNQGSYAQSANFALDTKDSIITNVSASQNSGLNTVNISYDLEETNDTTIEIDISEDGGATWSVTDTSVTGAIGSGVSAGTGKTITWNAGTDFSGQDQLDIRVRVRGSDVYANNSGNVESANFSLDTLAPSITNVSASQTSGTTDVVISYNLADNSAVNIALDISEDSGATWTVTDTSVTGNVGAGVTAGTGKTITWSAGTDFNNQDQSDLRVRVRGTDIFNNTSNNVESSDFLVDTLDPVTNATANLQAQPNAGDTNVLIGGSFTETNPNTNDFYLAINGGAYGSATSGDSNTATPANQSTAVGATLDGNDYISKVKITHTDDYGQIVTNENTSPTASYKYVKPYTPAAPTVSNAQNTSVDIVINKNASEVDGLEYAIYNNTTGQYVQANGTLGASAVWQTIVAWGTKTVTGLTSPVALQNFQTKSRNSSDISNASTSESAFSAYGAIINSAPSVVINSVSQETGGVNYVSVNYTGTDAQNDTNSLTTYQYSTDNTNWFTMTEKSGVGSDGTTGLLFTSAGANFAFKWDSATDLAGVEDSTVYVRIRSNDGITASSMNTSSAFAVDNYGPVVSNISVSQSPSSNNIIFEYDLADNSATDIIVSLDISEDGGSTWTVTDTSVTGDVGTGITAGTNKSITWSAGTDFNEQEQSDLQVRIKGVDVYGNNGSFVASGNFVIDTKNPVISNLSAVQTGGTKNVVISYDLTDTTSAGHLVELDISDDGGSTWTVTDTSLTGSVGSGQTTGTGKTITWNAGTDFNGQEQSDMRVRLRSLDYFANQSSYVQSSNFSVDTKAPVVSTITASQTLGTNNIVFNYDLSDLTSSGINTEIDISDDGGSSWTVTDTSVTGDVGGSITTGNGKSITWDAGTDFDNQEQSDMKVRFRETDNFGNISSYYTIATNFAVDTANPATTNVSASQTAGTSDVVINYDLSDANNSTVVLDISEDSGSTWAVATTTISGDFGSGITPGANKTITWSAGTDFNNQAQSDLRVRVRAVDIYNNQGSYGESSDFAIDTVSPVVSNVSASQTIGTNNVVISYDLTDSSNSNVAIDISQDSGLTWTVTDTSVTGNIGSGVTPGTGKTITWDAGTDFDAQEQSDIRVRVRATDTYANSSGNVESANFALDTKNPVVSSVSAVQSAGSTNVVITYNLTDANNSTVVLDISEDSGATWTVTDTSVTGDIGASITPGNGKTITWAADTDFDNQYQTDLRVRVRALDIYDNQGVYTESADFTLDTANPVVSNVTASQTTGTTNVSISYDLADDSTTGLTVELDISEDGGSTWTVTDTSVTGNIGSGQSTGTGKTITWDAGADFDNQAQSDLRVRVRAIDKFVNYGSYASSANFALDTLNPATNVTANLQAQPNAGSTTALIGGSFTESNPNTNEFYLAINGGAYGSATSGDTNTATPANLATAVGATLDGNDYISKVKITHTDDFGQSTDNENTSPTVAYKYVKPYTPASPTVNNPTANTIDVAVNKNVSEVSGLEYAIYENTTGQYVQSDSTLGASAVWQTVATWGTVTVTGLSTPVSTYAFQTKSRNSSDTSNAITSESDLSASASFGNTAPSITINSVVQTTDGTRYVVIGYTGTDVEDNNVNLVAYEYSTNNTTWSTMTEKSGVGSDGVSSLAFTSAGASLNFAWDVATDLASTEDTTVYIRLRGNDGIVNGNLATYSAFAIDTIIPVVSAVSASQTLGSNNVVITYNLVDGNNSTVAIDISEDSGATWTVTDTSVTSDIGSGVTSGTGKTITWDAGTDFDGQSQSDLRVRVRANDIFGNQSANVESSNFSLDTADPNISNVSASQTAGTGNVVITYDLSDSNNSTVAIDISEDAGVSWTVTDTSVTGDIGSGITAGTGKTITWNAGTDFTDQNQSDLRVRVRATDIYSNVSGNVSSGNFSLDTSAPTISSVSAIQSSGSTDVTITYNLADGGNSTVVLDISEDSGVTWTVTDTSVTGDIGSGVTSGTGKTITWAADTDFDNQYQSDMRVRVRATDTYSNASAYVQSSDFFLDTANPIISNLSVAQTANTNSVVINYDLFDNNNSTVELDISDDGGSTWTITDTSVTGDVGSGITFGTGKTITWDAGTDFDNQEQSDIRVRVRGIDIYTNQGSYAESSNFAVDTKTPAVSTVVASQTAGTNNVVVTYNLTEGNTSTVELDISEDSGATWTVTDTSVTGNVGAGVTAGTGKSITWAAGTDFSGQEQSDIRVRVRALDTFGNQSANVESSNFTLDTLSPTVSNVSASQSSNATNVTITYDLVGNDTAVEMDVSNDGGLTWTVTHPSVSGDIGSAINSGNGKTIIWSAGADFTGQEQTDMRVRVRGVDNFGNTGSYYSTSNFNIDTAGPAQLSSFSKYADTDTTVTLTWSSGVTDNNFSHYEIWHGSNQSDVTSRSGSALEWNQINDTNLTNINNVFTTITGLAITNNYYVKIWAVDIYGNESTVANINVYEAPVPEVVTPTVTVGGGGIISLPAVTPPVIPKSPVLLQPNSPTNSNQVNISGLADPRARIDIYDNGVFISRLIAVVNSDGTFNEIFTLTEGSHSITARSIDFDNNESGLSNIINIVIDSSDPLSPVVLSPDNNASVTRPEIILTGTGESLSTLTVIVNNSSFDTTINSDGTWRFVLPSEVALDNGVHIFTLYVTDRAGNRSGDTQLRLTKITGPVSEIPGVTPGEGTVVVEEGIPGTPEAGFIDIITRTPAETAIDVTTAEPIISDVTVTDITEATEVAGIQVPEIINASTIIDGGDFSFSGRALPNQDVVVYIHSAQALVYSAKADNNGIWKVNHSQDEIELAPGVHSIYAVAIDTDAKVKSRPSTVGVFTVERNFFVYLFNLLNLQTTIVVLVIIAMVIIWLFRLRKQGLLETA